MKLGFGDADNFLEFDIQGIIAEITTATIKVKVDFISFYRGVELLNFKNFCKDFISAYEKLEGSVQLFEYVGRFCLKMTFDKHGYADIALSICDDEERNKVNLCFAIEQSYLNDFYKQIQAEKEIFD